MIDGPDAGLDEPLELGGHALDRARGWTFESNRSPAIRTRSTFSARARSTVGREGGELALALGSRLLAEVGVARAEMDVGGVEQPQHPVVGGPPWTVAVRTCATRDVAGPDRTAGAARGSGASEAPP